MRKPPINDFALYRHYDAGGVLLYIGVTRRPKEREIAHRRSSVWHPLSVRREEERHPTRADVERAEELAVKAEGPIFNYEFAETGYEQRIADYLGIEFARPGDSYLAIRCITHGGPLPPRRRTSSSPLICEVIAISPIRHEVRYRRTARRASTAGSALRYV